MEIYRSIHRSVSQIYRSCFFWLDFRKRERTHAWSNGQQYVSKRPSESASVARRRDGMTWHHWDYTSVHSALDETKSVHVFNSVESLFEYTDPSINPRGNNKIANLPYVTSGWCREFDDLAWNKQSNCRGVVVWFEVLISIGLLRLLPLELLCLLLFSISIPNIDMSILRSANNIPAVFTKAGSDRQLFVNERTRLVLQARFSRLQI